VFWIPIRLLAGDRRKYLTLVFGLALASFLIVQQIAIFLGVMRRTAVEIENISQPDLWVMDPGSIYFPDRMGLPNKLLSHVRGVEGVSWAAPLLVDYARLRLRDGTFTVANLVGVDRVSRVGFPGQITCGRPEDLNRPDAAFWDHIDMPQFDKIAPGECLEAYERRVRIVGLASAPRELLNKPTLITTYEQGLKCVPPNRKALTFVLVGLKQGYTNREVAARISTLTGTKVLTQGEYFWATVGHNLRHTGIPANFGVTVLLGLLIGMAITAQTFYAFTVENLPNFAILRTTGAHNRMLVWMILAQALLVGLQGWGIGVGIAALSGLPFGQRSLLAFYLPPGLLAGSLLAILGMAMLSALFSIRKVLASPPALLLRR
jgi:putative ABC transport system permease protein